MLATILLATPLVGTKWTKYTTSNVVGTVAECVVALRTLELIFRVTVLSDSASSKRVVRCQELAVINRSEAVVEAEPAFVPITSLCIVTKRTETTTCDVIWTGAEVVLAARTVEFILVIGILRYGTSRHGVVGCQEPAILN